MDTVGFINYIEKLRYSRNLTQEEFLHGVISVRQYQRYRNGENDFPIDVLEKISKKLGIETRKLYLDYEREIYKEKEKVETLYNAVVYKDKDTKEHILLQFKKHMFLDMTNNEIYSITLLLNAYLSNSILKNEFLSGIFRIINYPKILKCKLLREVEIIGLLLIYKYEQGKKDEIITLIKKLNDNQDLFLTGQSFFTLILFTYYIADDYGKKEEYNLSEKYVLKGIEMLKRKHSVYCLYLFYYQMALIKRHTNKKMEMEEYLYKCILQLKSMHNCNLFDQMARQIKRFLNKEAEQFFFEYIKKHQADC